MIHLLSCHYISYTQCFNNIGRQIILLKTKIEEITSQTLSADEESALWYVGGYIIRAMTHRLDRSKFVFKEEMTFTLIDFIEHKECDNDLEESADLDPEMCMGKAY